MHSKICLSIWNITYDEVLLHLKNVSLAEIRIDLLNFTDEQFEIIFSQHKNLISTYRAENDYEVLLAKYYKAIEFGCAFVDVDIHVPEMYRDKIADLAHSKGCKVILSYHNFYKTPNSQDLTRIIEKIFASGADIAKLACLANSKEDCSRVLGLYEHYCKLVAFSMGDIGKITRLVVPLLGAPFTYASIDGCETAPGQILYGEVERFLERMEEGR